MMVDDLINVRLGKWRVGEANIDRPFVFSLCTDAAAEGLSGERDKLYWRSGLILGMQNVERLGEAGDNSGRSWLVDLEIILLA